MDRRVSNIAWATYMREWRARNKDAVNAARRAAYRANPTQFISYPARVQAKELLAKLRDVPCVECGVKFPPECMQFDHVRGTKRKDVSRLATCSVKTILEEVAKCDVVCANCHAIRTVSRLRALVA